MLLSGFLPIVNNNGVRPGAKLFMIQNNLFDIALKGSILKFVDITKVGEQGLHHDWLQTLLLLVLFFSFSAFSSLILSPSSRPLYLLHHYRHHYYHLLLPLLAIPLPHSSSLSHAFHLSLPSHLPARSSFLLPHVLCTCPIIIHITTIIVYCFPFLPHSSSLSHAFPAFHPFPLSVFSNSLFPVWY